MPGAVLGRRWPHGRALLWRGMRCSNDRRERTERTRSGPWDSQRALPEQGQEPPPRARAVRPQTPSRAEPAPGRALERDAIRGDRAAPSARVDAVEPCGIEAEDAALRLARQRPGSRTARAWG